MLQHIIQEQIDILSQHLRRSVAVDDIHINLVAVSKHFGSVDDMRMQALVKRTISAESINYLYSFGIRNTAQDVVVIEPSKEIACDTRRCYPVRWEEEIVGFLWIVGETSPQDDAAAIATAKVIALPLNGIHLTRHQDTDEQESLVKDLIFGDTHRVSYVTYFFAKQRKIIPEHKYRVLCVTSCAQSKEQARADVALAKQRIKDLYVPISSQQSLYQPLWSLLGTELILIMPDIPATLDISLFENIVCAQGTSSIRIGIGEAISVFQLHDSYVQASSIVRVLCVFQNLTPLATWNDLGVYGNLAGALIHKGMACCAQTPNMTLLLDNKEDLLKTLETYLDNGGNIGQTATQLHIHRSTLYYRLSHIEDITSLSLKSGLDRLMLHLEIKLWRLHKEHL